MDKFEAMDSLLRQRLRSAGLPETFCVMPWTSLFFSPSGHLLPCCNYDWEQRGSLRAHDSLLSAANDAKHVALRETMLEQGMSESCRRCHMREENQQISQRMGQTSSVSDEILSHIAATRDDDQTLADFRMMHWDLRYDNTCNLACRTCSPGCSSTIAAETKQKLPYLDKEKWQAEMLKEIPHVINAHFAGGEPLLMPGHRQILREIIAQGKADSRISYNTNLTRLDHRGDDIIPLWKQLSNLEIMVSLDHVGPAAGYVRHGTDWSKFIQNWERLNSECPHAHIGLVLTWSLYNALDLCDIIDHVITELGTEHIDINYVGGEIWYPWNLPTHVKVPLRDKMLSWSDRNHNLRIGRLIRRLADDVMQTSEPSRLQGFRRHVAHLDRLRSVSMADSLPNLWAVLVENTTEPMGDD